MKKLNTITEGLEFSPQKTELEATATNAISATEDTTPVGETAQTAEQTVVISKSIAEPSKSNADEIELSGVASKPIGDELPASSSLLEFAEDQTESIDDESYVNAQSLESTVELSKASAELSESAADELQVIAEISKPTIDESDKLVVAVSETVASKMVTVPIRFNHERLDLTIDEAADLSQKGLAAEPVMSKLRYLASIQSKSVGQVVDELLSSDQAVRREQILKRVGGDEELTNQLLAAETSKYQKAADDMAAAEELTRQKEIPDMNNRLAKEFLGLQKDFPNIGKISNLPKSVINEAVDKNISLFDSYLRFLHCEKQKIEKAKATQEAAERAAVGSQKSHDSNHQSSEIEAMIRGIWG